MSVMDPKLWGQLPDHLVEKILLLLPVRELCQLCRVSKTWNDLISSPRFAAAHMQRAAQSPPTPFVAMRCWTLSSNTFREGWSFLDLKSYKWNIVSDNHAHLHPYQHDCISPVAFVNDGLVCSFFKPRQPRFMMPIAMPSPHSEMEDSKYVIIIYNPVGISLKVLPSVRCHSKSLSEYNSGVLPVLVSIVDRVTSTFKVLFINQYVVATLNAMEEVRNEPFMKIYDSVRNEWRAAAEPFCVATRGVGPVSNTLVLNGFLYVLFGANYGYLRGQFMQVPHSFWRYNLATDAWEEVNINMDGCPSKVQFFASADRLYYLGWIENRHFDSVLELHEILLPEMTITTRFSLSKVQTVQLLENKACLKPTMEVTAAAFGNSVMLMSIRSKSVCVYDLETCVWNGVQSNMDTYPYNSTICLFASPIGNTNLYLPNSLW